jgi:hypothetical protein
MCNKDYSNQKLDKNPFRHLRENKDNIQDSLNIKKYVNVKDDSVDKNAIQDNDSLNKKLDINIIDNSCDN